MNKLFISLKLSFSLFNSYPVFVLGQEDPYFLKEIKKRIKFKLFNLDLEDIERYSFFIKRYQKPIIIINDLEGRVLTRVKRMIDMIPSSGYLIINNDNEELRNLCVASKAVCIGYGIQRRADLSVTDINTDEKGVNFKIDYKGSIVPFWINRKLTKKEIYNVLSAIAVGIIRELNLVEISEILK